MLNTDTVVMDSGQPLRGFRNDRESQRAREAAIRSDSVIKQPLLRLCERSEAIQRHASEACHRAAIRPIRWLLAMTVKHDISFSRRVLPEFCKDVPFTNGRSRECRAHGAPAVPRAV